MHTSQEKNEFLYIILCSVYVALLVCSNLICQKFFTWNPFGLHLFEISVGLVSYPITFLVTDFISEIYGKEKANRAVFGGLIACFLTALVVLIADSLPSANWSSVDDATFHKVFKVYDVAVFASLTAAVISQFLDVQVFHYFKKITQGRHLWLRNNCSTIFSQLVDTVIVNFSLSCAGILKWEILISVVVSSFLFKAIVALLDTPFFYFGVYIFNYKKISEDSTRYPLKTTAGEVLYEV